MFSPPPVPPFDGLHPIVVHFPIAIFLLVPLLVLASIPLSRRWARPIHASTLALMVIGSGFALLATASGEESAEIVEALYPSAEDAIEEHEEMGELARTLLIVATAVYALVCVVPMLVRRSARAGLIERVAQGSFVVLLIPVLLVLANAAHAGGVLVHGYGVRAPGFSPTPQAIPQDRHDDDDDDD